MSGPAFAFSPLSRLSLLGMLIMWALQQIPVPTLNAANSIFSNALPLICH